jgi:ATP citrate (pro-S)-lyase
MSRPRSVSQDSGVANRNSWDEADTRKSGDSANGSSETLKPLFTSETKSIVWGMQTRAVQSMLDFDFVCRRKEPSVAAMGNAATILQVIFR